MLSRARAWQGCTMLYKDYDYDLTLGRWERKQQVFYICIGLDPASCLYILDRVFGGDSSRYPAYRTSGASNSVTLASELTQDTSAESLLMSLNRVNEVMKCLAGWGRGQLAVTRRVDRLAHCSRASDQDGSSSLLSATTTSSPCLHLRSCPDQDKERRKAGRTKRAARVATSPMWTFPPYSMDS